MSKYTSLAASPKEAVLATQTAIKHAVSGRPGPSTVVMRSAAIGGDVDLESPPFIHDAAGFLNTTKPESAPADIQRAIDILSQSRRPVLVAGNGVHVARAHGRLQELVELWNIPVATSYKGKSAIAETHPLSVGMVGTYGQDVANRMVGDADTVIVVGALLRSQETVRERPDIFDPRRQRIIQIDIDERNAGWSFPVELGLIGDAGSILGQLAAASLEAAKDSAAQRAEWSASIPNRKQEFSFYDDPEMHRDSSPVTPQRLVSLLRENSEPSTVYTLTPATIAPGWPTSTKPAKRALSIAPAAPLAWVGTPSGRGPQAGLPRPPGDMRDRRRRLHDDGERSLHRNAVRPAHYLRSFQQQLIGYGVGPPTAGPDYRLRVLPHR